MPLEMLVRQGHQVAKIEGEHAVLEPLTGLGSLQCLGCLDVWNQLRSVFLDVLRYVANVSGLMFFGCFGMVCDCLGCSEPAAAFLNRQRWLRERACGLLNLDNLILKITFWA